MSYCYDEPRQQTEPADIKRGRKVWGEREGGTCGEREGGRNVWGERKKGRLNVSIHIVTQHCI